MGYTYVANWELGFSGTHEVKEHSLDKLLEQWQISKPTTRKKYTKYILLPLKGIWKIVTF
jgi:hypothetical protein